MCWECTVEPDWVGVIDLYSEDVCLGEELALIDLDYCHVARKELSYILTS
jgi:hypothetical protein